MWLSLSAANPRPRIGDSLYTREAIEKLEKKMTPDRFAKQRNGEELDPAELTR